MCDVYIPSLPVPVRPIRPEEALSFANAHDDVIIIVRDQVIYKDEVHAPLSFLASHPMAKYIVCLTETRAALLKFAADRVRGLVAIYITSS